MQLEGKITSVVKLMKALSDDRMKLYLCSKATFMQVGERQTCVWRHALEAFRCFGLEPSCHNSALRHHHVGYRLSLAETVP